MPNAAAAAGVPALQAHGLHVNLGGVPVLHGIDVRLRAGAWTSIVGPNGAGKSTLLRALAGLVPAQGRVQLLGQALHTLPRRVRAQRLSWLGQNEGSAPDLSVYDLVLLGRLPHQGWLGAPSGADHAAAQQALQATQGWDWRHRAVGTLSGGERQRVLLARALAVQAEVLLMDEPLANLDPPHQADWLQLVRALVAQGRTVVSVLHEVAMALHADDLLILAQGYVRHHGPAADPATHAALQAVFDQRLRVLQVDGQWMALPC